MSDILAVILSGGRLDRVQTRELFTRIMRGEVEPAWLGGFLCALAGRGECSAELVGAAEALRAAAVPVRCPRPCLDTCGTGGDGISTFNVSTTAAIIASAAGAVVAKHGNRTNTRASGSAEVLSALGVNIDAPVPVLERCLAELGLAFLFAPNLHPAMKHAAPVRRALGVRTIFNLLGPLCNPAGAAYQVLGVSRAEHVDLLAGALGKLGAVRAWVVHGADGLCDLSITGPSQVAEVAQAGEATPLAEPTSAGGVARAGGGAIRRFTVEPAMAGLATAPLAALLVASPAESAAAVRGVLQGEPGPRRDHALLNAAAALVVGGLAADLRDGVRVATAAVDSGAAAARLDALVRATAGG